MKKQTNCVVADPESSQLLRFNYSSLYDKTTPRDILAASRNEKQVAIAVTSIQNELN